MKTPTPSPAAPDVDRASAARSLVVVGCSARKTGDERPIAALDRYLGGAVPQVRARLGAVPAFRDRVRILSAEHGLLHADTPIGGYDRALDPDRAAQLRPAVTGRLVAEFRRSGVPEDVLVVAEPLYLVLLADLLALPARPRVHWVPDPASGWPRASAVLDAWGW